MINFKSIFPNQILGKLQLSDNLKQDGGFSILFGKLLNNEYLTIFNDTNSGISLSFNTAWGTTMFSKFSQHHIPKLSNTGMPHSQPVTSSAQGICLSRISLTLTSHHSGSLALLADRNPQLIGFPNPNFRNPQSNTTKSLSVGITPSLITPEGPNTSCNYAATFLTLEDRHSTFLVLKTRYNQIKIMSLNKARGGMWNHYYYSTTYF